MMASGLPPHDSLPEHKVSDDVDQRRPTSVSPPDEDLAEMQSSADSSEMMPSRWMRRGTIHPSNNTPSGDTLWITFDPQSPGSFISVHDVEHRGLKILPLPLGHVRPYCSPLNNDVVTPTSYVEVSIHVPSINVTIHRILLRLVDQPSFGAIVGNRIIEQYDRNKPDRSLSSLLINTPPDDLGQDWDARSCALHGTRPSVFALFGAYSQTKKTNWPQSVRDYVQRSFDPGNMALDPEKSEIKAKLQQKIPPPLQDDQSAPLLNIRPTPIREVIRYSPSSGTEGTKIEVCITSLGGLMTENMPTFFLHFGNVKCQASLTKMVEQGDACQHMLAIEAPSFASTDWTLSKVPILLSMESGDGSIMDKVDVGSFTYIESSFQSREQAGEEGNTPKAKVSVDFSPIMRSPGPPTDSGYASITYKLQHTHIEDRAQRSKDARSRPVNEGHASATDNTYEIPQSQEFHESDDASTVYSDVPALPALEIERYKFEFAQELFSKFSNEQLDEQAMERIYEVLPDLLEAFALRVGHNAPTPVHRDIMVFVHRYRSDIVRHFKNRYSQTDNESLPDVDSSNPSKMSLDDIMSLWDEKLEDAEDVVDTDPSIDSKEESEHGDEETNSTELPAYRNFIFETPAYEWLLASLRREFHLLAEPNLMRAIRQEIIRVLPRSRKVSRMKSTEIYKVTFQVAWDPLTFIKEQGYKEEPDEAISLAITLTGSVKDAQALTCAQYLCQTWPISGNHIILLVQEVIRGEPGHHHFYDLPDKTMLTSWIYDSKFMVEVSGTKYAIAEIGEQLAWLGAALRSSPYEIGVVYSTPYIRVDNSLELVSRELFPQDIICNIDFVIQREEQSELSEGQCWHNMFRNPVVVKGYPIPRRSEPDTGLEIPLNIMAGLIGTRHINIFNEQLFIKSFSMMLVRTKEIEDLLIWHLFYDKNGHYISYSDNTVPYPEKGNEFNLEGKRNIVGWCSEVKYRAGAPDIEFPAKETALSEPHQGCVLENNLLRRGKPVIDGNLHGIGYKDISIYRQTYDDDIDRLKPIYDERILLWDEDDKRGWLVNGISALLHLVRASLKYDSIGPFSTAFCFKQEHMQEDVEHTAHSATRVLLNSTNLELEIYPKKEGYIRLKDRVNHFLNVLDQIITYQFRAKQQIKLRPRKYLEGWDFRDLAGMRDHISPRVAKLQPIGKGWVDFSRAIGAVTLFGRGFGEIFEPADNTSLCTHWAKLPKARYYLAASISDLKSIMAIDNDGRTNPMTRDGEIIWHNPDKIFEPCQCMGKNPEVHSDIVQVLLPRKLKISPKRDSVVLKDRGAVIFGQNIKFRWFWKDVGNPEEGETPPPSEDSDSESEPELNDSGIGLSLESTTTESSSNNRVLTREHYKIGIVCALPKELKAIRILFDNRHGSPAIPQKDTNHYALGQIGQHNVVAACLPDGQYGTNSAANVITHMMRSFTKVENYLLVGIGGGVPSKTKVRLGDVVVGLPENGRAGVIQHDFGKVLENNVFERTGEYQQRPSCSLLTALSILKSDPDISCTPLQEHIEKIVKAVPEYAYPGINNDRLFASQYIHNQMYKTCEQCDGPKVERECRTGNHPYIHYGLIASGNQLMKNAQTRDDLGREYNILCFEMEAAGIIASVPCLVIRGICDYADSHKNDLWQEYACASAAAYTKLLLSIVGSQKHDGTKGNDLETVQSSQSRKRTVSPSRLKNLFMRKKQRR